MKKVCGIHEIQKKLVKCAFLLIHMLMIETHPPADLIQGKRGTVPVCGAQVLPSTQNK